MEIVVRCSNCKYWAVEDGHWPCIDTVLTKCVQRTKEPRLNLDRTVKFWK